MWAEIKFMRMVYIIDLIQVEKNGLNNSKNLTVALINLYICCLKGDMLNSK